jgi:hypothetical protein
MRTKSNSVKVFESTLSAFRVLIYKILVGVCLCVCVCVCVYEPKGIFCINIGMIVKS